MRMASVQACLRETASCSLGRRMTTAARQQQGKMTRGWKAVRAPHDGSNSSSVGATSNFSSLFSPSCKFVRAAAVSAALVVTIFSSSLPGSSGRSSWGRRQPAGLWPLTAATAAEAPDEKNEAADSGSPAKLSGAKLAELLQMDLEEVRERMEALFSLIDTNNDDNIDENEAREWSLKLKNAMHQHQVQMEFQAVDKNNDGKVSFEELAATYVSGSDQKQLEEHKEEVRKRFKAVDKDGNALLDLEEVMLLMDPGKDDTLTQLEIEEILATQDKNKDQKITLQEFIETEGGSVSQSEKQELEKEFAAYDLDHDGSIDAEELRQIIKNPHGHEIDTLLAEFMKDVEGGVLPKARWSKEYEKFAVSMLTDNGEALRYPEDYEGIQFPYSASTPTASAEKEAKEHDEL